MAKYDSVQHLKSMEPLVASRLFDVKGKVAVVTGGSRGQYTISLLFIIII